MKSIVLPKGDSQIYDSYAEIQKSNLVPIHLIIWPIADDVRIECLLIFNKLTNEYQIEVRKEDGRFSIQTCLGTHADKEILMVTFNFFKDCIDTCLKYRKQDIELTVVK